jgi:hypothetical protein
MHRSKKAPLLDHLVGAGEHARHGLAFGCSTIPKRTFVAGAPEILEALLSHHSPLPEAPFWTPIPTEPWIVECPPACSSRNTSM